MNILIVEDDKLMLKSLQTGLEHSGHQAYGAESAEDAINYITHHQIDLLISDVMMSGISGLSLVSVLRNVYLLKIPIILISTLDNMLVLSESLEIGADCFLPKPFTLPELLEKIDKVKNLHLH